MSGADEELADRLSRTMPSGDDVRAHGFHGAVVRMTIAAMREHDAARGMVTGLRVAMVAGWIDDCEDFPEGPCVILAGDIEAVKAAGRMLGDEITLLAAHEAPPAEGEGL